MRHRPREPTGRASRPRSRTCGRATPTTTASTGSCWPPTSTGARRSCCGPTRAGSCRLGLPLSQAYMEEALASNAAAARTPARSCSSRASTRRLPAPQRRRAETAQRRALDRLLDARHAHRRRPHPARLPRRDRRDAAHQLLPDRRGAARRRPYLALKLDPRRLAELPQPKPMFEIFVYSPARRGRAPAHGAASRAAACAGPTGARTSAPKSSA